MQCKSLWIKASAKCINVNVNVGDFGVAMWTLGCSGVAMWTLGDFGVAMWTLGDIGVAM